MKISIDENICKKHNLSPSDVLLLLYLRSTEDAEKHFNTLIEKEKLVEKVVDGKTTYRIPINISDSIDAVLLDSDTSVPQSLDCEKLAIELRALFPKGLKVGSSAWRGNLREVTLRLQKFFKLYGNNYTSEQIIDATKRYVASFNGNYTYMRILKYFILKSDKVITESEKVKVEDISELATWLDMDEGDVRTNSEWAIELK